MVDLQAAVTVAEKCPTAGQVPIVVLAAVTSNEPDDANGVGDGNTTNDIQEADLGTADFQLKLRSERDGTGNGRVYTLTYAAFDAAGNSASGSGLVFVPHDQRGSEEPIVLSVAQSGAGTAVTWSQVPGAILYNAVRGDVKNLRQIENTIDLGPVACIEANFPDASTAGHEDFDVPATGEAFFYLVAYTDGWGSSGYGTASTSKPRVVASGDCR